MHVRQAPRRGAKSVGKRLVVAAFFLALALIANAPHIWFHRGAPSFDLMVHYRWSMDVARAMAAGDPWPHWMPTASLGLGEPALLYYAPLYYLLSGLIQQVTGNTWAAMHVVEVAASFGCGWFAWALVRDYTGGRGALVAGVLAVLSPMAIMLNHGFNGFPWVVAFAPVSYLFWAMLRSRAFGQAINLHAMVALALVLCTHTISGLMCMLCLAPLAFVGADGRLRVEPRRIVAVCGVFVGGLLLAAIYFWPAVAYRPLIDEAVFKTRFTPWDAFVLPTFTARMYGMKWFALQVPIPLVTFGVAALGAFVLLRGGANEAQRRLGLSGALMLGVAAFFALEPSYPLWRLDTPLRYIQFPFRLTAIAAVVLPVLVGVALGVSTRAPRWSRSVLIAGAAASVVLALAILAQTSTQGRLLAVETDRLTPYPGLPEYRTSTRGAGWHGYVDAGLLPGECRRLELTCSVATRDGAGFRWRIATDHATEVRLPLFEFPAFVAAIDGREVPHRRDDATGLVMVTLPPGAHDVYMHWRSLPAERAGLFLSIFTAIVLATLALVFPGWRVNARASITDERICA